MHPIEPIRELTTEERRLLAHVTRWGSDGYPVARDKDGNWSWSFSAEITSPTLYATKREAVEALEAFLEVLRRAKAADSQYRAVHERGTNVRRLVAGKLRQGREIEYCGQRLFAFRSMLGRHVVTDPVIPKAEPHAGIAPEIERVLPETLSVQEDAHGIELSGDDGPDRCALYSTIDDLVILRGVPIRGADVHRAVAELLARGWTLALEELRAKRAR